MSTTVAAARYQPRHGVDLEPVAAEARHGSAEACPALGVVGGGAGGPCRGPQIRGPRDRRPPERRMRLGQEVGLGSGSLYSYGPAVDGRQLRAPVEVRRRRRRPPLERGRVPRVHRSLAAREMDQMEVDGEEDLEGSQADRAEGDDDVPVLLVLQELVLHGVVDAAHLATHPDDVHREERHVEEDRTRPRSAGGRGWVFISLLNIFGNQ